MSNHEQFLTEAVHLAVENVGNAGGPFGAVIVKDGKVIAKGVNRVTDLHDPTAHAEVMAIREACTKLQSFTLTGCTLYTSCEPCPMCLGAIYWARLENVYYAADRKDAAKALFDDDFIYQEIGIDPKDRGLPFVQLTLNQSQLPFDAWSKQVNRTSY
ncbi:nucleoside deaminase [Cytobacillus sp. FSL W7-1323]|uniref:nucleoside deaminase n=1 Tax=Cytobacillus TaxID=2675230 RepID=UPI00203FE9E0|nr:MULTISPECIES: nucleoside deaminase [Cytobacillus]MCM3323949.1 nucleoside deaminase [Cytobacillus kochii]MCM3346346.1 nucleoside deaminase [Cytobacillus kochii]MEA1854903.1 nucleoside deaminase [Cytobacillus sp. OWB-43]